MDRLEIAKQGSEKFQQAIRAGEEKYGIGTKKAERLRELVVSTMYTNVRYLSCRTLFDADENKEAIKINEEFILKNDRQLENETKNLKSIL